ncbi:hypothetical protein AMK17_19630 [Streptomyces sp. CB00072]|nr:hypothetical protein AMK17_19630 [Streptomyces sp. CB00072]
MASVCACGEYFNVSAEGELCLNPGVMGLREIVYFRTPGTHQFRRGDYPSLARVRVRVQGAGGGSGGADSDPGGSIPRPGAAAGGYSENIFEVGELSAVETVVVGAGGTGGVGNNPGTDGGSSAFGGVVTAFGGGGGSANSESGTTNITANGISGAGSGAGEGAIRISASQGMSGRGGDSMLGFGGYGQTTTGPGGGTRGWGAGAGGAFSCNGWSQPGTVGGNGTVIVELYG